MIAKLLLTQLISWSAPQGDTQILLKQVIERRSEMEELARDVKSLQDTLNLKTQQSEAQLSEIDSQIQNLVLKKAQLIQKRKILKSHLEESLKSSVSSKNLVKKWIGVLRNSIENSIPYDLAERKRKIQEIEKRFQNDEPALSALWSLWTLSSEELNLTRGIHYDLQKDSASGSEREVVRLGMWKMYEIKDNKYSLVEKMENQWSRRDLISATDISSVDKLKEAAKKKSFQKVYTLPQGEL